MSENAVAEPAMEPVVKESEQSENLIPTTNGATTSSYSMLEPRMKRVYGAYYKELYYTPERRVLEPKVQELVSLAASLVAKCDGCIDGHLKKALALGATKEEISETICIATAINAASIIDLSDKSAARLNLKSLPFKTGQAGVESQTSDHASFFKTYITAFVDFNGCAFLCDSGFDPGESFGGIRRLAQGVNRRTGDLYHLQISQPEAGSQLRDIPAGIV